MFDSGSAADAEAVRVMRSDGEPLSPFDMKRLESYAKSVVEHHMIQDLVPAVSRAFFAGKIPVNLSYGQAAILLSVRSRTARSLPRVRSCFTLFTDFRSRVAKVLEFGIRMWNEFPPGG